MPRRRDQVVNERDTDFLSFIGALSCRRVRLIEGALREVPEL